MWFRRSAVPHFGVTHLSHLPFYMRTFGWGLPRKGQVGRHGNLGRTIHDVLLTIGLIFSFLWTDSQESERRFCCLFVQYVTADCTCQLSLEGRSNQFASFLTLKLKVFVPRWRYLNVGDIVHIPIFIEVFFVFRWGARTRSSLLSEMESQQALGIKKHVMYTENERWLAVCEQTSETVPKCFPMFLWLFKIFRKSSEIFRNFRKRFKSNFQMLVFFNFQKIFGSVRKSSENFRTWSEMFVMVRRS